MYRSLCTLVVVIGAAALPLGAVAALPAGAQGAPGAGSTGAHAGLESVDVPIVPWSAPQFFESPRGVVSNMTGAAAFAGTPVAKDGLVLNTLVSITPCRLVDTRGAFSPAIPSPGPFAANEIRTYRIPGNCGVTSGSGRVKAVSLAITTPPTAASGDIEVVPDGATLGSTVVMVIQAGQWNSATTVSGTDADGDIKVQLRGTAGHVVIDINGYYAAPAVGNVTDYIAVIGRYDGDGGLLFAQTSSTSGGAVRAVGPNADVRLAQGAHAIDVAEGSLRVRGAGLGTGTFVFRHQVNSAVWPSGTLCGAGAGFNAVSVIDHPHANVNPVALLIVTPVAAVAGVNPTASYFVFYGPGCPGNAATRWSIVTVNSVPIQNGLMFNVMVVRP